MKEDISYYGNFTGDFPVRLTYAGTSFCDGSYRIARNAKCRLLIFEAIEQGRGTLRFDSGTFSPEKGDVFLTPGWVKHSFFSDSVDPWVKNWISVSGPLPEMLLQVYSLSGRYFFSGCPEGCGIIAETVRELKKRTADEAQIYIQQQLLKLVMALHAHTVRTASAADKKNPAGAKLHAFLMAHVLKIPPTLEEMSQLVGYSKAQSIRLFREEFGMTPYAFLLEQKIGTAADMLCNTAKSIKNIADVTGFRDEYYFSRIFKKKTGMAPGEYRRRHGIKPDADGC